MFYTLPREPLERIGIYNFKAFGEYTEIEIGKLTILSGLNSAGKSSIYQALLLLVQSQDSYLTDVFGYRIPYLELNGELVKLGASEDILHDKEIKKIGIVLTWPDNTKTILEYELQKIESAIFENKINYHFILSIFILEKNGKSELKVCRTGETWSVQAVNALSFSSFELLDITKKYIKEELKSRRDDEPNDDGYFWPFKTEVNLNGISILDFKGMLLNEVLLPLEYIEHCLEDEYKEIIDYKVLKQKLKDAHQIDGVFFLANSNLSHYQRYQLTSNKISYIPPFRGYPQRIYTDSNNPNPIGLYASDKRRIIAYLSNINRDPVIGTVEEALQYWIVDHFQLAEKIEVEEPIEGLVSEIFLIIGGNKIPINNVGFGTSQIVPVIFKTLINSTTDIFIIDEPEIHLHASLQSKLATFFYHMISLGKCIILETHSEYLIDKTIYHVLLNEDKGPKVLMYWIINNMGQTIVKNIEFDELGYLIDPPEGFLYEKKALVQELNELRSRRF